MDVEYRTKLSSKVLEQHKILMTLSSRPGNKLELNALRQALHMSVVDYNNPEIMESVISLTRLFMSQQQQPQLIVQPGYEKTKTTMIIEVINVLANFKKKKLKLKQSIPDILYFFEQTLSYEIDNLTINQMNRVVCFYILNVLHHKKVLDTIMKEYERKTNNFTSLAPEPLSNVLCLLSKINLFYGMDDSRLRAM
jgi:hypothetical protein